jgi:ABC-2 type transport system permease protein
MTMLSATPAPRASGEFWRRTWAMLIKEFIQLKRDRVSFAMIIMIPLVQLLLFGYAINTNPRHLPTAVLLQEQSDLGRSILKAIQNTAYFDVTHIVVDETEFDRLLASGAVLFAIEIPANFERAVRRGDRPALLVAADATDPVAAGSAMAALGPLVQTALVHDRAIPDSAEAPFEIRTHARYNPAANTSFNIVPGLVGTILAMTVLIFTALSVTREIERGPWKAFWPCRSRRSRSCSARSFPTSWSGSCRPLSSSELASACSACRSWEACCCWRCSARCSSRPIFRSAIPFRPSRRTSCRRCRCR